MKDPGLIETVVYLVLWLMLQRREPVYYLNGTKYERIGK